MLLTYLIILFIAIVFKIFHYPGTSLIFVFSPLFPFIDIIIQAIRKKGDKETNVLAAIALFVFSLFFLFIFLYWPGNTTLFGLATILMVVYIFRFLRKKIKYNLRFYLVTLLFLFAIFNFSLSKSNFRLVYMLEDPFNPNDPVPHFQIQSLAYEFYEEKEYGKAEKLIQRNINHINDLLNETNISIEYREIDQLNLEISIKDLKDIKKRTWNNFVPLYREDRFVPK